MANGQPNSKVYVIDRQGRKEWVSSGAELFWCGYENQNPLQCDVDAVPNGPNLDFPNACCPGGDPSVHPECSNI